MVQTKNQRGVFTMTSKPFEPKYASGGSISVRVYMEDFEYMVQQLWKCRKSEPKCEELYNKYKGLIPIKDG